MKMSETMYQIKHRREVLVNTDPQRRCYNGCNFSEEWQWTAWSEIDCAIPESRLERRLEFWRELNDIAVEGRGRSAHSEYKAEVIENA
jgi:hypothetical protein